jgi:hypothetical protein
MDLRCMKSPLAASRIAAPTPAIPRLFPSVPGIARGTAKYAVRYFRAQKEHNMTNMKFLFAAVTALGMMSACSTLGGAAVGGAAGAAIGNNTGVGDAERGAAIGAAAGAIAGTVADDDD